MHFLSLLDGEDFLPSRWNGTFNCSTDTRINRYDLEVTKSPTSIGITGFLYVDNNTLSIRGSYAYTINFLTLQSKDIVLPAIYAKNWTDVEINVYRRSSVFMEGAIVFKDAMGVKTPCDTELRRSAGNFTAHLVLQIRSGNSNNPGPGCSKHR